MAAEKIPSERARAFKAWMAANGTNTRRVSERAGVSYTTLASFVQGATRSLKGENEQRIAEAYGQPTDRIFSGARPTRYVRIIGTVGANADGEVLMTTAHDRWDYVPIPPGGTTESVALEVHGHSMRGYVDDGGLVYFEIQRTPPTPDMLNHICIVETEDGRILLKRLLRGREEGFYDLESANGPLIENVRILWAAEPTAFIPANQARKIIRRGGDDEETA